MKKPKIKVIVTKEDTGYSAFSSLMDRSIHSEGETFEELRINVLEAVNLSFSEQGISYNLEDLSFTLDLASFFDFYKIINAKALSQRIGMNQSLLAQYINGIKKPSAAQLNRILHGVQQIGRELAEIRMMI